MHPPTLEWFYPFFRGSMFGLAAMLLHECGHIVTAIALGVKVKKVGLKWNKGLYTVRERGSMKKNLLIALAGPLVNILLVATSPWLPVFGLANCCFAFVNALPIEGSDGFRIAYCWQQMRKRDLMI
jgi:Zn-dependent protease